MLGIRNPAFLGALAGFSPLDLSPALWLDAADTSTITASSGSVSQWNDKSGNGYNLVQASASDQPTTGTRTVNGLNALDFDGSTDFLQRTTATQLVSSADGTFTAFAVFQTDTVAAGVGGVITQDFASGTRMPQMIRRSAATVETVRIAGGVFVDATASTLTTTAAVIGSAVHRTNNIEAWIGGSSNGATSTTGTNGTIASVVRIGVSSATTSGMLNGVIGEIVVYSRVLTNAEMNLLGQYLASKWSVTWSNL